MSRRDYFREEDKLKKISIAFGVVLVLTIIVFIAIFNLYNKKLEENARKNFLELGSINTVLPNTSMIDSSLASSSEDKSIEDMQEEIVEENSTSIATKIEVPKHEEEKIIENIEEVKEAVVEEKNEIVEESAEESEKELSEDKPITFIAPLNGEIIKDFANETLVYSKTLEEWTVHNGIDIKAPKTTIVMASSDGKVESIKNDPRYGLTVTIAHKDGFKTVYANLLTAEFVSVGQEVEQGRTIGTVGESASFEIVDEAHLHFEIIKDGNFVNPTLYFK